MEYIERNKPLKQTYTVEITSFTSELFDKLPSDFQEWHIQNYGSFATCLHAFQELDERGLKALWACDVENVASVRLIEKLGFVNPVKYDFIFFFTYLNFSALGNKIRKLISNLW